MSRVITHLLKDIASLTRFHPDTSSRLCFLLGAREAIQLMLSVKEAPNYMFITLNVPPKEKSYDQVTKKVSKDLLKQGYEFEVFEDLGNVIMVTIRDRKKMAIDPNNPEELSNKYILDQIKHKGYPQVILRRQASIDASMGANIVSGDISGIPPLSPGDEVVLMDMYYEIVGHGVADMSSEEIKRSPGRIAVRTLEGRYDVPKFHDNKYYRNGLFSVTTLPRLLGANVLEFNDEPALILMICQDNGEMAVELLNRSAVSSKIFLITRNENHRKAINSTLERLSISEDRILILQNTLDRFTKSRPRERFTHFYVEMASTETGKRPNPYFDLEEKSIISNARSQFSALRGIALVGASSAQIAYITHSIDPTENEEVIVQAFRQGNFKAVEFTKKQRDKYPLRINALPEIPTVTQTGSIDLERMKEEGKHAKSWLRIDPRIHNCDGGFVAKLILES